MSDTSDLPLIIKRNIRNAYSSTSASAFAAADGHIQPFKSLKLLRTLKLLSYDLDVKQMRLDDLVSRIKSSVGTQMSSSSLQSFAASMIAMSGSEHPDYALLAGRMLVADLHKSVSKSFVDWVQSHGRDLKLNDNVFEAVARFGPDLDDALEHDRDFRMTYFSVRSLMQSCLLGSHGLVLERPQFMYMRVAIAIRGFDLGAILATYEVLCKRMYTHATPVMRTAGTEDAEYSPCFIFQPRTDTVKTLLASASDLDDLWLAGGGVGMSLTSVPAQSMFGHCNPGLLRVMAVYDAHAAALSGRDVRRPPMGTVWLSIWHLDVRSFIFCRSARVAVTGRMKHLFPGLRIPDLFMTRLKNNGTWCLFDPLDVPELDQLYGDEFDDLYTQYERSSVDKTLVRAVDLFRDICEAQKETGTPFIHYENAANAKSNQQHNGFIRGANLCTEIVQFSDVDEPAVCTLASLSLPAFLRPDMTYDFRVLHEVARIATFNTDMLIDRASYPSAAARQSALRHRALGIGQQGLADCLQAMSIPFGSITARQFARDVSETIYHAALEASCELAELTGPYDEWEGSPASMGILQPDMWEESFSDRYNIEALRTRISSAGLRNAVLTAQMPTATTSHFLGNSEGTEPRTRQVRGGEFTEVSYWLVRDLERAGLWTTNIRDAILRHHGSVAAIAEIPDDIKAIYRTAWEIDPFQVIEMAAVRGPFIDQSESLSLYVPWPDNDLLREMQLYAWGRGLKTGIYYLRTRAPTFPFPWGVPVPDARVVCPVDATTAPSPGAGVETLINSATATVHAFESRILDQTAGSTELLRSTDDITSVIAATRSVASVVDASPRPSGNRPTYTSDDDHHDAADMESYNLSTCGSLDCLHSKRSGGVAVGAADSDDDAPPPLVPAITPDDPQNTSPCLRDDPHEIVADTPTIHTVLDQPASESTLDLGIHGDVARAPSSIQASRDASTNSSHDVANSTVPAVQRVQGFTIGESTINLLATPNPAVSTIPLAPPRESLTTQSVQAEGHGPRSPTIDAMDQPDFARSVSPLTLDESFDPVTHAGGACDGCAS